jgi:hypothetical protein
LDQDLVKVNASSIGGNSRNRALALVRGRNLSHILHDADDLYLNEDFDFIGARAHDLENARCLILEQVTDLDKDALKQAYPGAIIRAIAQPLDLGRARARDNQTPNSSFDIYFDIVILGERVAGRFPAFEGIRLVKERVRS